MRRRWDRQLHERVGQSNKHINLTNHDAGRRQESKGSCVVCRLRAYRWAEPRPGVSR